MKRRDLRQTEGHSSDSQSGSVQPPRESTYGCRRTSRQRLLDRQMLWLSQQEALGPEEQGVLVLAMLPSGQ
jgi:hypothetical protein